MRYVDGQREEEGAERRRSTSLVLLEERWSEVVPASLRARQKMALTLEATPRHSLPLCDGKL